MNKKKLTGFGAIFAGIAAAIVSLQQPHDKPVPVPVDPPTPTYTLVVHACDGDCARDEKLPGAVLSASNQKDVIADGAGNGEFPGLKPGQYAVCGKADGFKLTCLDRAVPADGGEVFLALERDVPPIQALHTDGKIFRTADGQPWRWRGVSAFQLLDRYVRGEDLGPFLRAYAGYNVLRVWPYVPAKDWGAKAWGPPPAGIIRDFIDAMGRQGWYVEFTLLTDDDPARLSWALTLVPQLVVGGCPSNLLIEGGNEPTTHKRIDTPALRGVLAASGCLYASGDYEDSARAFGSYLVAHTSRDSEWPRRAHDALEYYGGGGPSSPSDPAHKVPVVLDEPAKLQDVGGDRMQDWRAYFGAASLLGAGATFHSETGKWALPPTADEAQLAAAALEGLNAFPADAPLGPYARPDDASLRTYIVGPFMVRIRPSGGAPGGWTPIDTDGILWRR